MHVSIIYYCCLTRKNKHVKSCIISVTCSILCTFRNSGLDYKLHGKTQAATVSLGQVFDFQAIISSIETHYYYYKIQIFDKHKIMFLHYQQMVFLINN